jgi:hypothetical protein
VETPGQVKSKREINAELAHQSHFGDVEFVFETSSLPPGWEVIETRDGRAAPDPLSPGGAASVASFVTAVFTELYLCNVCSCQEITRRNGRG